jgi:DNA-binding MurR/RpiR family transcriptional regulator
VLASAAGKGNVMPIRNSEPNAPSRAVSSGDIIEELRRHYDRLTQSQKRIAEYIIEHSQEVAFSTVDQMAERLDVNPSTIVRFTYRLGLNGFPDLQERMQELVRGQLARTGEPINESHAAGHLEGTSFGASLSHDWQNLHHTIASLDAAALDRAVDALARARWIYVVAGFSTFSVAHYFALVLDRLRSNISLLGPNDVFMPARLVDIKPEDCLLAFTFPPYAKATYHVAMWAKENKAKVIAVTDSPISALGQIGDIVLLADCTGIGTQNSMVAPMALANALLNGVAAAKGTSALKRCSRHDGLMHRWDAFLLKSDNSNR